MFNLIFVCHGNICRSPMAEFITKRLSFERGVADRLNITSAGTSGEELGNPVYPAAKRKLAEHGITCEGKRAVRLAPADIKRADLIVVMDETNRANLLRLAQSAGLYDEAKEKVRLLLEFTTRGGSVADPWYTDDFDVAWRDIYEGCAALLDYIVREGLC